MVAVMAKRDDLFQKFGPLLLEATLMIMLEETNRLRAKLGMPEVTKQDVLDQFNNHLSELEPYSWMEL